MPINITKPLAIGLCVSPREKANLRKLKTLSDKVKTVIYTNNLGGPDAVLQFQDDLRTYGMWEALLYVEGYEKKEQPLYKEGTAYKALLATGIPSFK